MAPRSIFHHISFYFPSYKFPIYNISFRSTIFAIFYFPIYKPKIPKIFTLSPSDLTFASNREGIDNPFTALGASLFDSLCKNLVICALSPTGLIPWFSNWGKYLSHLSLLCCITLSSSREKPTQAQEVAGRTSSAVTGEIYTESSHTKYPS